MARPEGVRIMRADGTVLPCELRHLGVIDGMDEWEITGVTYREGDMVQMDVLPARTGIRFAASLPGME